MGKALPFSEVDLYLKDLKNIPGCIVDTQFLVAIAMAGLHKFEEDALFMFEKLAEYKVPIYSTVTTRSEFIEIHRRKIISEAVKDMLSDSSKWRIADSAKSELQKHRQWLDRQSADDLLMLNDSRIKDIKQVFLPKTQSGKSGWLAICDYFLKGKLLDAWSFAYERIGLNHIDFTNEEIKPLFSKKVDWGNMLALAEKTCLGSSDAMILNMLNCSVFPFIVSADYDLAYGVLAEPSDKVVLMPDALYSRHIKKLRF